MLKYIILLTFLIHSLTTLLIEKSHIIQANSKQTLINEVDISKFYGIELADIIFKVKKKKKCILIIYFIKGKYR